MGYKELNRDAYDRYAEEYMSRSSNYWGRCPKAVESLQRFIDKLPRGARVLDLGSGGGRDSVIFKSLGFKPLCVDFSTPMLKLAQLKGLSCVAMDLEALAFADESFDAAWAYTSLMHIPHEKFPDALQCIAKLLKPGGVFLVSMFEGEGEEVRSSPRIPAERFFALYSRDELINALWAAGFSICWYQNPDDLLVDLLCEKR